MLHTRAYLLYYRFLCVLFLNILDSEKQGPLVLVLLTMAQFKLQPESTTDEGASPGASIQLNENALRMFSTLINMGFDDQMSIRAANKYPHNAEQAITWINTQNSTPKQPHKASHAPVASAPRQSLVSQPKPSSINPSGDIDSWVTQNNLGNLVLTALEQNGVDSLDDLRLLSTEQEMNEFANDLGLKIMQRKKFVNAVKKLIKVKQPSQQSNIAPNRQYQSPPAYNPSLSSNASSYIANKQSQYANSQQSMNTQLQYSQQHSPYKPQYPQYPQYGINNKSQSQYGNQQHPAASYRNDDEKKEPKVETPE